MGTDRFRVGKSLGSETKWVQDELVKIDGRLIRIVDTPGFDDTNLTDTQVLETIVAWMSVQSVAMPHAFPYLALTPLLGQI